MHPSSGTNRSSTGVTSSSSLVVQNNEPLRKMLKIVNSLFARSDSAIFREPVDWRGLELWDYPKVIKRMMDLGTVKRKLEGGQYNTAMECAEDIRLIWKNCMDYNVVGSEIYLVAENFSKRFEDRFKKVKHDTNTGESNAKSTSISNSNSNSTGGAKTSTTTKGQGTGTSTSTSTTPSLEDKVKLGSLLFKLSGVELGHVLQVLDQKCPRALERPACEENENEIEINVDNMDAQTFYELDSFVMEKTAPSRGHHHHHDSSNSNNKSSLSLGLDEHEKGNEGGVGTGGGSVSEGESYGGTTNNTNNDENNTNNDTPSSSSSLVVGGKNSSSKKGKRKRINSLARN